MKKNSFMVKTMLMSIATAVSFAFTACSDDVLENQSNDNAPAQTGSQKACEAYGLCYYDFVNENDVQILNNDSTEISVSKKLADKLGIATFVNHPLGIWQAEGRLPFGRKAVDEKLVGETYILKVVPATVAELIGENAVTLNTSIYYNEEATPAMTRGNGGHPMSLMAAQHTDENNVIHPCVIHMTDPYGYDNGGHYPDELPKAATRAASNGEYRYMTAKELAQAGTRSSARRNIIDAHTKVKFNKSFDVDKKAGESIDFTGEIPLDFNLNYFITIDTKLGWSGWHPTYDLKTFEAGIDGSFSFKPEAYIKFTKKVELPEDKQKIKLYSFPGYSFTFVVGVVPVYISLEPSLFMKFNASVEGNVKVGFKYEYENEFRAGCRYEKGKWSDLSYFNEKKNNFEWVKPEAEFSVSAGAGLFLGMDVKFYKIAGPELGVGPELSSEFSMKMKPYEENLSDKFEFAGKCDLKVKGFAGAKVEILGWQLAEWSTEMVLAGPWTIASTNPKDNVHKPQAKVKAEQMGDMVSNLLKRIKQDGYKDIENQYNEMLVAWAIYGEISEDEALTQIVNRFETNGKIDIDKAAQRKEIAEYIVSEYKREHPKFEETLNMAQKREILKLLKQRNEFKDQQIDYKFELFERDFYSKNHRYPDLSEHDIMAAVEFIQNLINK